MKWVPLLVVLGFLGALLLVNRHLRSRTGHRLFQKSIQGEIFGGLLVFLLTATTSYADGRSPLRALVSGAIVGVPMFLVYRWQLRRRNARQL